MVVPGHDLKHLHWSERKADRIGHSAADTRLLVASALVGEGIHSALVRRVGLRNTALAVGEDEHEVQNVAEEEVLAELSAGIAGHSYALDLDRSTARQHFVAYHTLPAGPSGTPALVLRSCSARTHSRNRRSAESSLGCSLGRDYRTDCSHSLGTRCSLGWAGVPAGSSVFEAAHMPSSDRKP